MYDMRLRERGRGTHREMEVDETQRDGWCPTDVVSNEIDVKATLSVLISVIASAYSVWALLMNCQKHPVFNMFCCAIQLFQTKSVPVYLGFVLRFVQNCLNIFLSEHAALIKSFITVSAFCQIINCLTDNGFLRLWVYNFMAAILFLLFFFL